MNTPETLRHQYLEAMGIQRWKLRAASATLPSAAPPASVNASQDIVVGRAIPIVPISADASSGLDWPALEQAVRQCTQCGLHSTRTQTVFGVGDRRAKWMFIGEAPGADEDHQGEPFVGRAGQLLNAILFAMGLKREEVYIANVIKCRPPGNRDPQPEEVIQCEPYLIRQIEFIQPRLIVALGRHAAHSLLKTEAPLNKLRGQRLMYQGIPLIATYHPAYLLRSPAEKCKVWDDLCLAKRILETS